MDKTHIPRVERDEDGIIRPVKKENTLPQLQGVKEQIAMVQIKGVLLGTITLKTPFKELQDLIKKANHYSCFWLNSNEERVVDYDMLRVDESEFPITAWMFPDSKSIKEGVYEDLPF